MQSFFFVVRFVLFLGLCSTAFAAERALQIVAPAEVPAGGAASAVISASTNFEKETIAFLHIEYSIDNGKTWQVLSYETNAGEAFSRRLDFAVAPTKSKAIVRARAAYRGTAAGDVDYNGASIAWDGTWAQWRTPPTRYAVIYVGGR